MQYVGSDYEIIPMADGVAILKHLERITRLCYKSEDKITDTSYISMMKSIISRKHFAMLEHATISVLFQTDRGVTHEMVRHRIASFAQESTRYCNYSNDKFGSELSILAVENYWNSDSDRDKELRRMDKAVHEFVEHMYMTAVQGLGAKPQEARRWLTNATKAGIVVTANIREWRHIFDLRAIGSTGAPHPDMVAIMTPLLLEMANYIPIVFDDLVEALPLHK